MANTTNYQWVKATIGGSEDTWGATINTAFDAIDTLLGGTDATEFAVLNGATVSTSELNKLDGVTATTAEINALTGMTATSVELSYSDGVTSAIQTQIDAKSPLADPTFTGTLSAPTANVTTVDLGDWTITQTGSDLIFSHSGTARLKLSSAGALIVEGDVTAFGDA